MRSLTLVERRLPQATTSSQPWKPANQRIDPHRFAEGPRCTNGLAPGRAHAVIDAMHFWSGTRRTEASLNTPQRPPKAATLPANPTTPAALNSASSLRSARAINCRAVSRCGSTGPRK